MSLIFSSGGGRLGNQSLNLIHLTAISFEYNINVYKISDLFICGKNKSLLFKIQKNNVNWQIVDDHFEITKIDKLFLKLFIRIIHFYFYFSPNCISYRIGLKNNLPKFIHVVAPTVCNSPRASIGLSIDAASIAPSAAPAPTNV